MKTLVFIGDDSNQVALAASISKIVSVGAVVVRSSEKNDSEKSNRLVIDRFFKLFASWIRQSALFPLNRAWFRMLEGFEASEKKDFSQNVYRVGNINEKVVFDLVEFFRPQLVLVSGTNLLSSELIFSIRKFGEILNLHTGLSPFVNGGPNCTNWCLYLREFDLIGNTVMYIDKGIDTGDILTTERVDISHVKTLEELHTKVMRHAHELYLKAIAMFIQGHQLPRIPQRKIQGKKRTFFSRDWSILKELIAAWNFWLWRKTRSRHLGNTKQNVTAVFPLESNLGQERR